MVSDFDRVRVRVAPSPTGDPHVGLAYISLFNYAFAKKHGGDFILRIEDTDQQRAKESSDRLIMSSLSWLGLAWDEGPDRGGPCGPYRQSERLDIYHAHAQQLISSGAAYHCFCSSQRLDEMRQQQRAAGDMPRYDGRCRELDEKEVAVKLERSDAHVIRLKMPRTGDISFNDHLRGEVVINALQLDDQVLIKSDGFPTYHLANVVDDHLMKISHVIRAEEWISSTPKHIILYDAFGWKKPTFIHMPLLRNSDKSKISKRKNPVSLTYYQRKGILPEAMVNFLALMGWSMGNDQEVFSLDEMIAAFDFKNVSLGGPVFDTVKLVAINKNYLQRLDPPKFVAYMREQVFSRDYLLRLYPQVISRFDCFEQFTDKFSFFFNGSLEYPETLLPKKKEKKEVRAMLGDLAEVLDELYEWNAANLQKAMDDQREALAWKPRDYYMTVRLATTGRKDSPPLAEAMELIGREMVRFRLRDARKSRLLLDT